MYRPPADPSLAAENERLRAENNRLRAVLAEYANPDNWEHQGEYLWLWNGFPPFERATWTLLAERGEHSKP